MTIEFWVGPVTAPDTYELVELLGGGGEGEVWRAVLPLSAKGRSRVAIKIMSNALDGDDDERWDEFGKLLRSLSHPGLVRVVDVFSGAVMHRRGDSTAAAVRYVVMDYIEGPTLREWSDEHPDATAAARLRMLRTVASALDEMHCGVTTEVAVAHGDVKPANIVVRDSGATVLVDLGLARLVDASGASGRSAPYAAPELRGRAVQATPAGDVWAFAVTAAQVLIGTPPPLDREGFLDLATLRAQLATHPMTRRRPTLVRRILEVLEAPPEARPRLLRPWLDGATDSLSQVTGPGEGQATAPPSPPREAAPGTTPPRGPGRQRRAWLAVAATLVVMAGTATVALATSRAPVIGTASAAAASSATASMTPTPTVTPTPTPTPPPTSPIAAPAAASPAGGGRPLFTSGPTAPAAPIRTSAPQPVPVPAAEPEPAPAAAPAAAQAAAPARPFVIKGFGGKCLDVQGPSTADGTPVQMWTCNGAAEMTWQVVGSEIHGFGGKCLDVRGPSTQNGTLVQMWDCNGATEMKWEVVGAEIRGFGGKCLDVQGPSTADGTPVQMWDCNGASEELWSIQRAA